MSSKHHIPIRITSYTTVCSQIFLTVLAYDPMLLGSTTASDRPEANREKFRQGIGDVERFRKKPPKTARSQNVRPRRSDFGPPRRQVQL